MKLENNKKYSFTGNTGSNYYQCVTYDMFKLYEVPVTGFSMQYNVYFYGELFVGVPEDEWNAYQGYYYNYYISPSTTGINFIMENCPDDRGVFETTINNTTYITTPLVYKDNLGGNMEFFSKAQLFEQVINIIDGKNGAVKRLGRKKFSNCSSRRRMLNIKTKKFSLCDGDAQNGTRYATFLPERCGTFWRRTGGECRGERLATPSPLTCEG